MLGIKGGDPLIEVKPVRLDLGQLRRLGGVFRPEMGGRQQPALTLDRARDEVRKNAERARYEERAAQLISRRGLAHEHGRRKNHASRCGVNGGLRRKPLKFPEKLPGVALAVNTRPPKRSDLPCRPRRLSRSAFGGWLTRLPFAPRAWAAARLLRPRARALASSSQRLAPRVSVLGFGFALSAPAFLPTRTAVTPASETDKVLVTTSGPTPHARDPIALGHLAVTLALALILGTLTMPVVRSQERLAIAPPALKRALIRMCRGARCGRLSIAFASPSFLKRSIAGSQ